MIEVRHFHKCYDTTVAARDISFHVAPGEVLGLIGPNGAGKTTTLRALTGIIHPTEGELVVDGFSVEKSPIEAKQRLAYIPDDPQLFHDLTVIEHLTFAAKTYRVANPKEKIAQLIETFELTEKRNARAGDLSRGMRQKLAISCGYVHDPKAILFDEPLTGLDPAGIRSLKESIRDRASRGTAIMISSHLLAMVEDICTHVMILKKGQQQFFGPIDEVRTAFSAGESGTSLEDIFFRATSDQSNTPAASGIPLADVDGVGTDSASSAVMS
ncbi:MAG: ABC transporter ATP-binding protein [Planctomycetales bacterium]|nr:ABC transporter ATP-binding protein [Planctomycetales bacterium]